jgi:hypothetical protein
MLEQVPVGRARRRRTIRVAWTDLRAVRAHPLTLPCAPSFDTRLRMMAAAWSRSTWVSVPWSARSHLPSELCVGTVSVAAAHR